MSELQPFAKAYILTVNLLALVAVALAVLTNPMVSAHAGLLAFAIAALVALAWLFPLPISFKTQLYLDSIPLLAAILLLPPGLALSSVGLGTLAAHLARRRPLDESAFNSAQAVLQATTGVVALTLIGWSATAPSFESPVALGAVALTGVVIYLTNDLLVAGMVSLQSGRRLLGVWLDALRSTSGLEFGAQAAQFGLGFILAATLWFAPWAAVLLAPLGALVYCALGRQIQLRRTLDSLLQDQETMLDEAQRLAHLGSWTWDLRTGRHSWSRELHHLLGETERVPNVSFDTLLETIHPADRASFDDAVHAALRGAGGFAVDHRVFRPDGEVRLMHSHGSVIGDESGRAARIVATMHDVTERRAWEVRLTYEATHDQLTGLFNRAYFIEALERAIGAPERDSAALFIDLDCFKDVNDQHGHQIGDELLVAVAERIRAGVRPTDIVARLGGDEFTVLLQPVGNIVEAGAAAERLANMSTGPYRIREHLIHVDISIGWTPVGPAHQFPEHVLEEADQALYRAKRFGRGRVVQFADFHGPPLSPSAEDMAG